MLFTGDDYMRLDKSLASWVAEFGKRHGDANIQDVDLQTSEEHFTTILGELLTPSLFASKRLMIVRGLPGDVSKKSTDASEKIEQALLHTLQQVPEDIVVLLISRKPDKRRSAYKKLISFVRVKEFLLKDIDVAAQVTMELAGMVRSQDVAYLVQVLESRRESMAQDMTMLRQYGMTEPLTREAIDMLCPPHLEESIFIILDAVFSGRHGEAVTRLRRLFDTGAVPLQVLGAFGWQMEMLTAAQGAIASRSTPDEVAAILDVKPFSVNKAMKVARHISKEQLGIMISGLANIDRLSKTGGLDMDNGREFADALAAWITIVPGGAFA